ncbi:trehalose transporter 1-like protein [Lycorma delicatula]|uniref:trehalose transporter 1-like protein n=1 Tax=Lycorma delicatula TaxID=130591 RepID=UPI003F5145E7
MNPDNIENNSKKKDDHKCSFKSHVTDFKQQWNNLPAAGTSDSVLKLRSRQVLAATGPFFSTLAIGMTSGFSAVLLPQLMETKSIIKITNDQSSWIASIAVLPMIIGCILSGFIMEKFGRRPTQRAFNILFIIGWILISCSNTFEVLCIGRSITGLCVGLFSPLLLVYVAEISDPHFRGVLLATNPLAISVGVLLSHLLGTFFYWKTTASVCATFPLIAFIILLFAPESPSWLILKGHKNQGEQTFRKLRGFSPEASIELKSMLENESSEDQRTNSNNTILCKSFLRPLFIMLVFFVIQQWSGVNAVIYYSVFILSTTSSNVNEYLSTAIIDILRVFMSTVTCILLKKFNRRSLALFSSISTGISLLCLTISLKFAPPEYSWITLPFMAAYVCFICTGTVPLPWILTGEMFPSHVREIGSGCCTCFAFLMFFTVVKTSPLLFKELGAGNVFLLFALVALFGSVFIFFFLPETKNRSLHDIEQNKLGNKEESVIQSSERL